MPSKREEARLMRLNKIKARKEAKLEASSNAVPVDSAVIYSGPATVVSVEQTNAPEMAGAAVLTIKLNEPEQAKVADHFADPGQPRRARIYARPINVRMRLIEFEDDKSHGKLWVKQDSAPMLNWLVWVKPDDTGKDWVLHGKYNARGIRLG